MAGLRGAENYIRNPNMIDRCAVSYSDVMSSPPNATFAGVSGN